jgi:hypothetical protein
MKAMYQGYRTITELLSLSLKALFQSTIRIRLLVQQNHGERGPLILCRIRRREPATSLRRVLPLAPQVQSELMAEALVH